MTAVLGWAVVVGGLIAAACVALLVLPAPRRRS